MRTYTADRTVSRGGIYVLLSPFRRIEALHVPFMGDCPLGEALSQECWVAVYTYRHNHPAECHNAPQIVRASRSRYPGSLSAALDYPYPSLDHVRSYRPRWCVHCQVGEMRVLITGTGLRAASRSSGELTTYEHLFHRISSGFRNYGSVLVLMPCSQGAVHRSCANGPAVRCCSGSCDRCGWLWAVQV